MARFLQTGEPFRPGEDEIMTDGDAREYLVWQFGEGLKAQALAYFKELRSPRGGFPLHVAVAMVCVRMRRLQNNTAL